MVKAVRALERAVALDPSYAAAHAWLAYWHLFLVGQGWVKDRETPVRRAGELAELGLADQDGTCDIPIMVLNVVYPLVPDEILAFVADKRAVLVLEEGQPEYIEQELATMLRRRDIATPLHGKDFVQQAGELGVEAIAVGQQLYGLLDEVSEMVFNMVKWC